ncbi:MAG TPA: carboxypeptidase-like regulatory domain-containing protein [Ignavibacteria bacterium]|nr:carboxypeptidase-like regulatory domain-containing protein [Ignavibacteria bacterium]
MKAVYTITLIIFTFCTGINSFSFGKYDFTSDKNGYPNERTAFVSGKVIDERGFPVPYLKVIIGDAETQTDVTGKFNIVNVPTPYDVTVADRYSSTAVIYKELSISQPELIFFGALSDEYVNTVNAKITFPKIPKGYTSLIKFISQDIYVNNEVIANESDSLQILKLSWPMYQNNLKGKIVYVLKNDSGYQTIKYKDVTFFKNNISPVVKINSKPGSVLKTSDVSVYFPEDTYENKGFSLSTNLFNYGRNSGIRFYENKSRDKQFVIPVPDGIKETFKIQVRGYSNSADGSGFVNYSYVSPGAVVRIASEFPPEIQTPSDNSLAVDGNARFSYSTGTGAGIFVLEFKSISPVMSFYIVTGERESRFNYLSRNEFKSGSVQFDWSVRKYLTYFTVDEFVKPVIFKNDFSYKAVLFSKQRSFKTGYR